MSADWDCEILTTCARETQTWTDSYAPGATAIGGVPAIRFPVDRTRDPKRFARASRRVSSSPASIGEYEAWMREQGPFASGLFAHLETRGSAYDGVFFFSYLYATTYFGLPLVRDRAVLVPLAHAEWMLGLPLFDRLFAAPQTIAYLSEEERLLVSQRFGLGGSPGRIVRLAVEAHDGDAEAFRRRYDIQTPFMLCIGRVEPAKGIDDLLRYEAALHERHPGAPGLVLAGPIAMALPHDGRIRALGRISERDKADALAACSFAVVPSAFESLSIVALEAWAAGRAVLANGASAVLVGQCRRSGGGLWFGNRDEFVALAANDLFGRSHRLGEQGARYVAATFTHEAARASLVACLADAYAP